MNGDLLLGIDVGTSSTKVVVSDAAGAVVTVASGSHPSHHPHAGWSEQEPRDWWNSAVEAIRGVASQGVDLKRVRAVGLSGQMHGSVFLEKKSAGWEPLRRALLWNDQRTAAECREIEERVGGRAALVQLVGNAALTGFTLPKILWVKKHEPHIFAKASAIVMPKDYVGLRLTGSVATDVGDASGTLLFDVDARRWSGKALTAMGLDPSLFPTASESADVIGQVTRAAAGETGLPEGIAVIAGSGDNQAGAIGAGVVTQGMVLATIGTSGVIYAHADRPRKDITGPVSGRLHTMCAATGTKGAPGAWSITGCMLSAGGSLQWCRDALFPDVSFERLMDEASQVAAGCDGLVFLPYLTGERCPYPDPAARGGWIGLTSRHTRGHLVRAVIEGVTFGMGQILDLVRSLGVPVEKARLGGGGAKSALWRQMQADVFGCPVALTNTEEGPAYGAALLAGVGAGVYPSVRAACETAIRETMVIGPRSGSAERYGASREVYGRLYHDLRERFGALLSIEARET